jgi:hypothetical protein
LPVIDAVLSLLAGLTGLGMGSTLT